VNILIKIVGYIKRQTGGMNPYQPRTFVLPGRPPLQPMRQTHGTMSAAEAAQKSKLFRQNYKLKTRKIKATNKANRNENYGNVYPVTNKFNIPVGNNTNSRTSRASSASNVYNLFNRPRHKAAWDAVFSNTQKKGGTRKNKLPKSNTPQFRKNVINYIRASSNITNAHKQMLIERYEEAARAGLATKNELPVVVMLTELRKYGEPKILRRRQ